MAARYWDTVFPAVVISFVASFLSLRDVIAFAKTCRWVHNTLKAHHRLCLTERRYTVKQIQRLTGNGHTETIRTEPQTGQHPTTLRSSWRMGKVLLDINTPWDDLKLGVALLSSSRSLVSAEINMYMERPLPNLSLLASIPELHVLSILCTDLSSVSGLVGCFNIRELDLSCCSSLRDISALSHCKSLVKLDLCKCSNLQDVSPLSACRNLEFLNLSYCTGIQSIDSLAPCHDLHSLILRGCVYLETINVLANFQQLSHLNMANCSRICDLRSLEKCRNLRTLDINWCEGLVTLCDFRPLEQLQSITAYSCSNLIDVRALGSCKSLEFVDLGWFEGRDVSALRGCTSLTSLLLNDSNQVANFDGLRYLTRLTLMHSCVYTKKEKIRSCYPL